MYHMEESVKAIKISMGEENSSSGVALNEQKEVEAALKAAKKAMAKVSKDCLKWEKSVKDRTADIKERVCFLFYFFSILC
jgi:hypothetical protein